MRKYSKMPGATVDGAIGQLMCKLNQESICEKPGKKVLLRASDLKLGVHICIHK